MLAAGMLDAHAAGVPTDMELARRVKGTLSAAIGAGSSGIEIAVHGGVVSLSGQVATPAAHEAAVSATGRTPGVQGVADNLSVARGS